VAGWGTWVSQDFFATVGIPLTQGREFTWSDTASQPPVSVVNVALASALFPRGDAVGQRIRANDANQVLTIVGVVADSSPGDFRITNLPTVYRPLTQEPRLLNSPILIVRASDNRRLAEGIRASIEPLGRHRVADVQTIGDQTDRLTTHLSKDQLEAGLAGNCVDAASTRE